MRPLRLSIDYKGKHIEGKALPVNSLKEQKIPLIHKLIIDGKDYGTIQCTKENWLADKIKDPELVKVIGIIFMHGMNEKVSRSRKQFGPEQPCLYCM